MGEGTKALPSPLQTSYMGSYLTFLWKEGENDSAAS